MKNTVYSNRYKAIKAKQAKAEIPSDAVIAKVAGGYAIFTKENYEIWRADGYGLFGKHTDAEMAF